MYRQSRYRISDAVAGSPSKLATGPRGLTEFGGNAKIAFVATGVCRTHFPKPTFLSEVEAKTNSLAP